MVVRTSIECLSFMGHEIEERWKSEFEAAVAAGVTAFGFPAPQMSTLEVWGFPDELNRRADAWGSSSDDAELSIDSSKRHLLPLPVGEG
jgi:hypothetical protein